MIYKLLKADITKAISNFQFPLPERERDLSDEEVEVTRTSDPKFGDFTTNVALKIASSVIASEAKQSKNEIASSTSSPRNDKGRGVKQSPLEVANKLADSLKSLPYIKKLEVAGPGFINFWIRDEVWQEEVEKILEKRGTTLKLNAEKRRTIVEFTDPNPFKEFHIGHLYSNIVGESICRLLETTGAMVKRANYQGDVGMHVAKTIWAIPKLLAQEAETFEDIEKKDLSARVFFLGQAYSLGAKEFEASEEVKKEVAELNKEIFANGKSVAEYYEKGRRWSLDYFEEIYKRLGTKFDFYYFESEVGKVGTKLVRDNLEKVFIKSDGAIIFPGEKYGLHNRVFINSMGLPTYEAKELGLAPTKYKDFAYDLSIIVTGNEISEYFKVLICALEQVAPDLAKKTKHIGHGMVRMPGGKISSRLGNVLLGEWLLDEAKKRALDFIKEVGVKVEGQKIVVRKEKILGGGAKMEELAEQIGVGAVKYSLLKGNIGQDVNFSFEESISLNGNSGPYLQYTYARCKSVQGKSTEGQKGKNTEVDLSGLETEEELLLRSLGHFEEAVLDAATNFAPNTLANFLYEVAQRYNTFYNNLPILKADKNESARRLFLTKAAADILKKGLYLLGISAPEKM